VIDEIRFHRVKLHLDLALGLDERIAVFGELGDDRFAPARSGVSRLPAVVSSPASLGKFRSCSSETEDTEHPEQ
jgi:hypothetical protein